jgi:osmotically-inducible protein OsmY
MLTDMHLNSVFMRNYKDRIEAAYMMSRRQGDMMRNPVQERSPHEDRRNRYIDEEFRQEGFSSQYQQEMDRSDSYFRTPDMADNHREGEHRGKGPRNYRRSDERILDDVAETLWDHPTLDASEIEIESQNGEVTLKGIVPDRESKRLAEDLIENIKGVTNIENRIRVGPSKYA